MSEWDRWLPWILFAGSVLGGAVKYGADQQKQKSKNDLQDLEMKNIKEAFDNEKLQNSKQHLEFYDNRNSTIELKNDMKHIMASIDKMMTMLERRREGER